jgi:peptide/nickel transport system substrate-binding protein
MFKALRRYYWLVQKFAARHYALILRTLVAVITISAGAVFIARYIPAAHRVSRIGLVGKYTPETLPLVIQKEISAGLVDINDQGDPTPSLSDSWQISSDGKKYTFHIRPGIQWHDGSTLIPSDIVYNFKEVNTEYGQDTVSFNLQEPFAPFLSAVGKPILKNGKFGTGTFKLDKSKIYSGVLQEVTLISDTDKLIYKFYPTESSALTAFKLGEVDKLDNISYVPADTQKDGTVVVTPNTKNSKIVVLFFNNNDSTLTSKSTRQGLAYAIQDKSFGHTRAISPIDKSSWGYNPLVKEYDFDAGKANNLFYTDVGKGKAPTLELKTTLGYLDIAESIATDWRKVLGIQVDVKVVTNIGTDYQILLTDYTPPSDPDQYTIWHSTQATNFTHYSNLKVDKLLEDGRRTLDKKLRLDIYQDFQRFLLEDCPAVFLFNTSGFSVARKPIFST